jgi:hypothetical protein
MLLSGLGKKSLLANDRECQSETAVISFRRE